MYTLFSFLGGLTFGAGLLISGMANPAKVQAFLDLAGEWDPSLAFVMVGAIVVGIAAFRMATSRTSNFLGGAIHLPTTRHIDWRLILGSVVFGIGWGLAGFCPGPALTALGMGEPKALLFVAAMLAGMGIYEVLERRRIAPPSTQAR